MKKEVYDKLKEKVDNLEKLVNGGKGSGNFGHSGRPGQVGGSGNGIDFDAELKALDKEGVPFTSPRYQALLQMQKEAQSKSEKLIGSSEGNLKITQKEFDAAKKRANERGGEMAIEKTPAKTYIAGNKFYRREFDSKKEAEAFKSGYDYADKSKDFTRVDYARKTQDGKNRWDVMYKKSDIGVHESASFKNPLEAQRWAEGYNSKITAIESEVPSEAWKKK